MNALCLDFTAPCHSASQFTNHHHHQPHHHHQQQQPRRESSLRTSPCLVELCPDGANRDVTLRNRREYVKLMAKHLVTGRLLGPARVARRGVTAVIPSRVLVLFSPQDLNLLLGGCTAIDPMDWKAHATYNGYIYDSSAPESRTTSSDGITSSANSRVIEWFWAFVFALPPTKRSLLLRFVTGSATLPVSGFSGLRPPFNITKVPLDDTSPRTCTADGRSGSGLGFESGHSQRYTRRASGATRARGKTPSRLPTAATCFNQLKLPEYADENALQQSLFTAIVYGSQGFGFT
jgi:hypothetical protein